MPLRAWCGTPPTWAASVFSAQIVDSVWERRDRCRQTEPATTIGKPETRRDAPYRTDLIRIRDAGLRFLGGLPRGDATS